MECVACTEETRSVQAKRPTYWQALSSTDAYRVRNDFLGGDLRPNAHIIFEDRPLTTNQWGMRGRDYSLEKAEGTYRIAVLGPSHVMGSGVADGETFADYLEDRLNRLARRGANVRYEVLNFGLAGCSLLHQLAILEERALKFQPDTVFITDSPGLTKPVVEHLDDILYRQVAIPFPESDALVRSTGVAALSNNGIPVPFESVRALLGAVGIKTRMPGSEAARLLRPAADSIVRWTLGQMASVIRDHGAMPVFVALDNVRDPPAEAVPALQDADVAGFLVFNLFNLWQGVDKPALCIGAWDEHPNAAGNQLIAQRLFELMQQHQTQLRLSTEVSLGQ